ncbi:hypothetical protein MUK42_36020 [Musa troglodytarum]|uniref:Uncharacterized protein n=1 Tax=Musa troglodytarum TaxID=320322 RepID=A0A9E7JDV6_9LILI|nr:hypothetical protein MUK42_36020 [Musa troglodytarum]
MFSFHPAVQICWVTGHVPGGCVGLWGPRLYNGLGFYPETTFFSLSCKKWWNEEDAGSRDQFFPKAKAAYAILRGGKKGELRLGFVSVKDLAREARRSEKDLAQVKNRRKSLPWKFKISRVDVVFHECSWKNFEGTRETADKGMTALSKTPVRPLPGAGREETRQKLDKEDALGSSSKEELLDGCKDGGCPGAW